METVARLLRALCCGSLAGLAVLGLDELMAVLTAGYPVVVSPRQSALYLGMGVLATALVESGLLALRRPRLSAFRLVAATLAVLATATAAERLQYFLATRMPSAPALALAILAAVVACGLWILALRRVLAGGAAAGAALPLAMILTAGCVAAGLAVNRHLFTTPLSAGALAADASVLGATLAAGAALRRFGARLCGIAAAATLIAFFALAGLVSRPGAEAGRPHLVLVVVDTLRQDVFRSVVDETAEGAALKRALGPAVWFDNAIAASPWTVPSTASILTGLHPQEHGHGRRDAESGLFRRLPDSVSTLAEALRRGGYRTEALVTNPWLHPGSGIERGFEHFELLECAPGMLPLLILLRRAGLIDYGIYQPAWAVRHRLGRRLAAGDGRPLFLWLHLMDPHVPLNEHPRLGVDPTAGRLPDKERLYRGEVRYALRETALMLELLERHGLRDDTVFVLVSDHGEMFASDGHGDGPGRRHSREGHGHALYEELVRVPLVIRRPTGHASERRVRALASHMDLAATVLDLLGAEGGAGLGGFSIAPWLAEGPAPTRPLSARPAVLSSLDLRPRQRALRTDTLKLIHFPEGRFPDELYDLSEDPKEQRDMARRAPERLAEARELLAASLARLAPAPDAGLLEFDAGQRSRLEALGYLN